MRCLVRCIGIHFVNGNTIWCNEKKKENRLLHLVNLRFRCRWICHVTKLHLSHLLLRSTLILTDCNNFGECDLYRPMPYGVGDIIRSNPKTEWKNKHIHMIYCGMSNIFAYKIIVDLGLLFFQNLTTCFIISNHVTHPTTTFHEADTNFQSLINLYSKWSWTTLVLNSHIKT